MKKVMLIFGTRPEAIKMCPLVNELKKRGGLRVIVCVTGQHRRMLHQALEVFGVVPDYDLSIMRAGQTLFDITAAVMAGLRPILTREAPDVALVHGDTATAFSAVLACFYLGVPVGHVEAGLRTYDMTAPYPEEFNRQAVDIAARYHFAPTRRNADNLLREGKDPSTIYVTGNTVVDAMRYTVRPSYTHPELTWAGDRRLILVTAHRRENLGPPMHRMFRALRRALETHPDCCAVLPIHPSPQIRRAAAAELGGCDRLHIIEPLDAADCHNFEARCHLCLTDSGGLQEECPSFGRPVLVMRDATERPEGVEAGAVRLVGTEEEGIYRGLTELLDDPKVYGRMARIVNPYGDGHACERIADVLEFGSCTPWNGGPAPEQAVR